MDGVSLTIRLPALLADVAGAPHVQVHGRTVADAVADLCRRHPGILPRPLGGRANPYPFVAFYLNGEPIRATGGFDTPVRTGDELSLVTAVAGG